MKFGVIINTAALLATFALSDEVSAAIVTVTYESTVGSGQDYTGVFGQVGHLGGGDFTAVYKFDTSVGTLVTGPLIYSASGGADVGSKSPSLGVIITINGVSRLVDGSSFGSIQGTSGSISSGIVSQQYHYAGISTQIYNPDGYTAESSFVSMQIGGPIGYFPGSIDESFGPISAIPAYNFLNIGSIQIQNYSYNNISGATIYQDYVYADLLVTSITEVAVAPEPDTWAMLLVGFGCIGGMMRIPRRRTVLVKS